MRKSVSALSLVLAAGAFLGTNATPCHADGPRAADTYSSAPDARLADAPRPGTDDEESAYARREAQSPDVQEFTGGGIIEIVLIALVVVVIIVLLM